MNKFLKLLTSVSGCGLVGILGTPFTISAIPTWYAALNKPFFSPPNWIFGPVWTVLYLLMGVSVFMIWSKGLGKKGVKKALSYFLIQLLLNFIWSILFFGLHSPVLALIDIILLWVTILFTIIHFAKILKPAAYLLIPYIFWVSFAALLNLSIVILN